MKLKFKFLILAAVLLLISCASLLVPKQVELPIAKLQASLDRRFPLQNRFLQFFDITATNPRLQLQPESNRVITTIDAALAPSFLTKSWKGTLTISGVLSIDAARRAVLITMPRLEKIAIDGVNESDNSQIAKISSLLADQFLKDIPLYTFGPGDFTYAGMRFVPVKIVTRSDALVVTFEPAR